MELYLAYVLAAGAVIVAMSFIALIMTAFRTHALWGFSTLFLIGAPFFVFFRWPRARFPVGLFLFGAAVMVTPYAINAVQQHFLDLGERDKIVDGERHLTLTGWEKTDYSVLRHRPDTIVLQMANADVTDATLDHLKPMPKLRELDLNDTKITDSGLTKIKDKPLVVLRLRNTAVTDAGFQSHLSNIESLLELDVRGTSIAPATFRAWKAAKPARKGLAPTPKPAPELTP